MDVLLWGMVGVLFLLLLTWASRMNQIGLDLLESNQRLRKRVEALEDMLGVQEEGQEDEEEAALVESQR